MIENTRPRPPLPVTGTGALRRDKEKAPTLKVAATNANAQARFGASFTTPDMRHTKVNARYIIGVPVNDLILIVLGAIPFPRSKRSIQVELWLACGSSDWIPYISQLRAHA